MTKRVLVIGERFFPEEFLINEVVTELLEQGFQVSILTQQPSYPYGSVFEGYRNRLFAQDEYKGAAVYRTAFVPGYHQSVVRKILNYFAFVLLGTIYVLTRIPKHDTILVYQTGPLTQALIGVAAKMKWKRPLYIWTWDIWPDAVFAYGFKPTKFAVYSLNRLVRYIYSHANQIWISSPGFKDVIQRIIPDKNLVFKFVPSWRQTNGGSNGHTTGINGGFNLTFTGNVGKVQNLENVIKGFGKAVKQNNRLVLNIIGDGSALPELKELVDHESIPNVNFWGRRPQKEMPAIYEASQALVISLSSESVWGLYIPSKFQDYLGAGKPILGVINGTVRDLIDENEIGVCVAPDDTEAISDAILSIPHLPDPVLQQTGKNAVKLLHKDFDRTTILEKIVGLLQK